MLTPLKLAIVLSLFFLCSCATTRNPWSELLKPTQSAPEPIGGYSAGCLRGAKSLYPDGKGYRVMRIARRRFYGHPNLVRFIEFLGDSAARKKQISLLIGDLGMARGGPTLTGHASHQSGLDVDIWYLFLPDTKTTLSLDARENLSAPSLLQADHKSLVEQYFTEDLIWILQTAAEYPDVERIFVHSTIKRALCNKYAGQPWLRKLRPWWGHDDHFHVRLRCPESAAHCSPQEPPLTDECERPFEQEFAAPPKDKGPRKLPKLPDACEAVLKEA